VESVAVSSLKLLSTYELLQGGDQHAQERKQRLAPPPLSPLEKSAMVRFVRPEMMAGERPTIVDELQAMPTLVQLIA